MPWTIKRQWDAFNADTTRRTEIGIKNSTKIGKTNRKQKEMKTKSRFLEKRRKQRISGESSNNFVHVCDNIVIENQKR